MGLLGVNATRALADTLDNGGIEIVEEGSAAQESTNKEGAIDVVDSAEAGQPTGTDAAGAAGDIALTEATGDAQGKPEAGAAAKADDATKAADPQADAKKDDKAITFINEVGDPETITDYTDITDDSFEDKEGYGFVDGYYVLKGNRSFGHRLTITGNAKLILCDGATAIFRSGIRGYSGELHVYGQSHQTGKLAADTDEGSHDAAIGGNDGEDNNTDIYIHGGVVSAMGDLYGAGIGGGNKGGAGNIYITGGDVTAKGGSARFFTEGGGAGIGSGDGSGGKGGRVCITGGDVTGYCKTFGAGIGAGDESYGVTVDISGGTVRANGGRYAAGIGTGDKAKGTVEVNISGGDVVANGGTEGAGIGGGGKGNGGDIAITGGHVRAIGGMADLTSYHTCSGAGIGGGHDGCGGNVQIRGGVVEAAGGRDAAAIGHGSCCDDNGTAYITDDYMVRGVHTINQGDDRSRGENEYVSKGRIDGWYREATLADTDERIPFFKYRSYVVAEPCTHDGATYKAADGGHKVTCKHCIMEEMAALEHEYNDKDTCKKCGFEKPAPKFAQSTVDPVGGMGPTFWIEMPKDGVKVDKVELSVGGKRARTECFTLDDAQRNGNGDYGFHMPLSVVEMAEPVKAVVSYNNGQKRESECTVEKIITRDAHPGATHGRTDTLESLANLGHYTHPWLAQQNHWAVNQDYTRVKLSYPKMNNVGEAAKALKAYDNAGVVEGREHIKKMNCTCRLDTLTAVEVYLTPKKGEKFGACTATMDGHEATCEVLKDGRLHVRVNGIKANDYDKMLVIEGACGKGSFKAQTSVLGYTASSMAHAGDDDMVKDALASIYWYFHFAKETVN